MKSGGGGKGQERLRGGWEEGPKGGLKGAERDGKDDR